MNKSKNNSESILNISKNMSINNSKDYEKV